MTNKQRIYLIIQQRRLVSLKDLQDITKWHTMDVLKAVAPLVIQRKVKAITSNHVRYFVIKDRPL